MPKIRDSFLDAVAFLYFSRTDAEFGRGAGGSGFIVGIPSPSRDLVHLYVVTNQHVAAKCSVVRLTSTDRTTVIREVDGPALWIYPSGNDDLAAWHMGTQIPGRDEFSYVLLEHYAVGQIHPYGPGDECFMLGRFVTKDGLLRNEPSARFGNISMLPGEQIERRPDVWVDAFLVETRSQAGYSGSPVFVYRKDIVVEWPVRDVSAYKQGVRTIQLETQEQYDIKLLGVDFAHLPNRARVGQSAQRWVEQHPRLPTDARVELGSGMLAVVPAWKLVEMLNRPDVAESRH